MQVVDRDAGDLHLLIEIRLLLHERLRFALVLLDARFERVALGFDLALLGAQRLQLFQNFLGTCRADHERQRVGYQRQQHHGGEDDTHQPCEFSLFHSVSF